MAESPKKDEPQKPTAVADSPAVKPNGTDVPEATQEKPPSSPPKVNDEHLLTRLNII